MQPDSDNTPLAQKLFGSATLQQQFLWMLVLRVFLYSVLLGADFLFQDERFNVIAVPIGIFALLVIAVYGSAIGSSVIFIRGIYDTRKFGFIQILLEVGFAATLIYLSGGSQSAFISVFFFAIITGSLLLPLKGGLVGASSATLLFGAILLLEHLFILPGYLRPQMEITSGFLKVNQFAIHGLMFFLAATVSGYIGLRLKSTIAELTSSRYDFNRLAELHQKIFNSISTGIITVNNHEEVTSANPAIESITGITLAEIIGKKYQSIFPACELTLDEAAKRLRFSQAGRRFRFVSATPAPHCGPAGTLISVMTRRKRQWLLPSVISVRLSGWSGKCANRKSSPPSV
jgi:two-component system sensor histidine kinase PilS (NtrC family)